MNRPEILEFDPVLFSDAENEFLFENLGLPPVVASRKVAFPVNPKAVIPIITKIYEMEQLKEHEGSTWVGIEALKKAIRIYLETSAKWRADARRSRKAPRFPSMYSFDGKGRPHLGGQGSDAGRVRTYFDAKGNRIPFAVQLIQDTEPEWIAPGFTEAPAATSGLAENSDLNRFECLICGHTESYKAESRTSRGAARARMSKHLRKATDRKEEHLEVYSNEFGS